ncbi:MAG: NAD-dependent epimerase/dehydratase family protein [Planctomycetota bacterium]
MSERVLVTGGGGFLGAAIVRKLVARGDRVRSVSRKRYPELEALGVECLQGDLCDPTVAQRACDDVSVIHHCAAKPGVWGDESEFRASNLTATETLLSAAQTAGVEKLIYTSSSSVVFNGQDVRNGDESIPYPQTFLALYPKYKALAEQKVLGANSAAGLRTVALRPRLILGPGDPYLTPRIVEGARTGRLRIVDDGRYLTDIVDIETITDAHLQAADRLTPDAPHAGKPYFITQGEPVAIGDILNRISVGCCGKRIEKRISKSMIRRLGWLIETSYRLLRIKSEPPLTRFTALQFSVDQYFSCQAAERDFGFKPSVSIDESLERVFKWWKDTHPNG